MPNSDPHDARQINDQNQNQNPPPPGYPNDDQTQTKKKCCPRTTKKGDRGFIEGCLFALCCCWICEECF